MSDMGNMGKVGADLLRDLADKITAELAARTDIPKDKAQAIGEDIAGTVADHWGGQSIYIAMDLGPKRKARNKAIYEKFTGDNQAALAMEHGLSVSAIYRILKAEGERRRIPQGSLLDL